MSYQLLRNLHLLFGVLALPFLLMYGVSAVQMAHSKWFDMRPTVVERQMALPPGISDSVELHRLIGIPGDLRNVEASPRQCQLRIVVPGTVHQVRYDVTTGAASVKTSVGGFMAIMNRLHHAAGLWPDYFPLKLWGFAIAIVSIGTIGMSATGLWMWWYRKQERRAGLVLIGLNFAVALTVLTLIRSYGP